MKNFLRDFDSSLAQYLPIGTRQLLYAHIVGVFIFKFLVLLAGSLPIIGEIAQRLMLLTPYQVALQGHLWQLFTFQFTYDLVFQEIILAAIYLLVLISFSMMFENTYGQSELWTFVILCGLIGGTVFTAIAFATGGTTVSAYGSIGALLGMLMLMTLRYPTMEVRLFFVIPIQLRFVTVLVVGILLLDFGAAVSRAGLDGALPHAVRLGGLMTALLVWKVPSLLYLGERIPWPRRRKKAKVVRMHMGHPGRHTDPDDRYNDPHWKLDQ